MYRVIEAKRMGGDGPRAIPLHGRTLPNSAGIISILFRLELALRYIPSNTEQVSKCGKGTPID